MIYVIDTNSFRVMSNYYPEIFPTFWERGESLVIAERLLSVREVLKELDAQNPSTHLDEWCRHNDAIFSPPTSKEMQRVADILKVPHFRQLIGERQKLRGQPVADPFLVARGIERHATVVTEEISKPNAAKIPNVCAHFSVRCISLQGLLAEEGWRF